jgi:catechol 2,3-dioxygenase-like lactoylglutathione lyase family enzyme
MGAPNGKVTWFEITTIVPPTDNPGGVRSAYLRDPDGSLFSIYRFGHPAVAAS